MALWQIDIYPKPGQQDRLGTELAQEAAVTGVCDDLSVTAAHGYLIQGDINAEQINTIAHRLLADEVVEKIVVAQVGDQQLSMAPNGNPNLVHILPKPGVTDAQAETTFQAINEMGYRVDAVRTFRKYWIGDHPDTMATQWIETLSKKFLANDAIEQPVIGPLQLNELQLGTDYQFARGIIPILDADDQDLENISAKYQLSLTLVEMRTIQSHYGQLGREPTDVELETIAQTWSEHCSHKTLAGRISYRDENGEQQFGNMLKETIFSATQTIRQSLGENDWCVSVFKDNAGVVTFDQNYHLTFKVETHNRPSALEPYGGANTGIGGVIRDTLGTGLGAKPICNTDVFCFAPPDMHANDLPPNVLHPRKIINGVVSGVRDYGNRMGIPTVNGALYFDKRYVGNPLVFCGSVGVIPIDRVEKQPCHGDMIVVIGGRTGRDGIHGATFSSAQLNENSEQTSGGAVQIGNAITEKMLGDVLIQARDRGLYTAVTDCGAGGFSSAVGEMGEELGAEVWLDKAPLKYRGLTYTEIWISESQERMVFAIPESKWPEFETLCQSESVEATVIGRFEKTGQLKLLFDGEAVAELSMEFLHDGRPDVLREAVFHPRAIRIVDQESEYKVSDQDALLKILGSWNVASKHWVIRQYDHEVQGGSVIKPLVGPNADGPGDAAVLTPDIRSNRGVVISCGMNPYYGDYDPYHMATSGIDEAVRNCVAVGADPDRIAVLDNFCWGKTHRPETLGSLVRAALGCRDLAIELQTPFISGKDSLHNEFDYTNPEGLRETISIPATLLISAMGQIDDVNDCVTMDFKEPGNLVYQVGPTGEHLAGSHFHLVQNVEGGHVPNVNAKQAKEIFTKLHRAIKSGLVRSCHDLSEGGLAVAVSEMAFAGDLGVEIDLAEIPLQESLQSNEVHRTTKLFSESNSRFLCEVQPANKDAFEQKLASVPFGLIGKTTETKSITFSANGTDSIKLGLKEAKQAWLSPLDWK